ncbi:DUF4167 domain-containing protein [Parvibaculum sp.]|jgi:hypothetical protein|uniref:DUF4167 domain-containing protein n=1 Tax=Parvibaculum sp. TaxID=2024848 RepID=UPI003266F2F7
MRQGQNNSKRSRGRGGRKPQHSANRAFDSNGPDVKIRGTAAHVCEKYQQLARDAISAGDRVTAENYYQHAEHYYRLMLAAQQGQEGQQQRQPTNLAYRPDEDEENETDYAGDGPQPRHPGQPWHQQSGNGQNGGENNNQRSGSQGGNGRSNDRDEQAASSSDDDGEETADANAQSGGEGEGGQPRRRNNRRRRPRSEGDRGERNDAPRAEAAAPADSSAD